MPPLDPALERSLRNESNRLLRVGTAWAMALAAVATAAVLALSSRLPHLQAVATFSLGCGVYALGLHLLARRGRVHGWVAWATLLPFSALPSALFLITEFTTPLGAATFLQGPLQLLYPFCVTVTGMVFNPRLSRVAGLVAGLSSYLCFLVARPHLVALPLGHEVLAAELTDYGIQAVRVLMLFATGLVVAKIADASRTLVVRALEEEREIASLGQLFGQYVSPEVKEKLVREKAGVAGERKLVAVLFADLRGFTAYSERRPPAEVVARLNRYFDGMVKAINRHGGTVDKFIGDAVMATFGGVLPLERPAEAALDAAQAMREALVALNAEWAREGLAPLENGIGLHFGEVLQGPIGSAERKEFTVIGDVVNTASRLESATKELGQSVVLSDALADALPPERRAGLRPLGEVKLKGRERPVTVFGAGAPTGA